jgi:hypothetical protein
VVIDPAVVSTVFTGLVGLLGGVATLTAARSRKVGVQRRDYRRTRTRLQIALIYIYRLGDELAERGIPIPPRPAGLDEDDDDEPVPAGGSDARP